MICKHCDQRIPNDSEYCPFCGLKVKSPHSDIATNSTPSIDNPIIDISNGYDDFSQMPYKPEPEFPTVLFACAGLILFLGGFLSNWKEFGNNAALSGFAWATIVVLYARAKHKKVGGYFTKKHIIAIALSFVFLFSMGCGIGDKFAPHNNIPVSNSADSSTGNSSNKGGGNVTTSPNKEPESKQTTTVTTKETSKETATVTENTTPTTSNAPEVTASSKVNGIVFNIKDVPKDVTGNWRISCISKDIDMVKYAVEYYNTYFKDDGELHAIVNKYNNTTTSISSLIAGYALRVAVHEHVKNEEKSAKDLFCGELIEEWMIVIDTGEATKLYPSEAADEPTAESEEPESIESKVEKKVQEYIDANYAETVIDSISVNDDLGTDVEGDYVAIVRLTWNRSNSKKLSKEVLDLYSSDMAARMYNDLPEIQELAVFWTVPYLIDGSAKFSFERKSDGMYYTDIVFDSNFD